MKQLFLRMVSFICILSIGLTSGVMVFAADAAPTVSVVLDAAGKNADIKLVGVSTMIYSAQITLTIHPAQADYTVIPTDGNAYGTVTANNNAVTVYVDSTTLMDGSKEISLAALNAGQAMTIGETADLILVDRSMKSTSYHSVAVSITQNNRPSSSKEPTNNKTGNTTIVFPTGTPNPSVGQPTTGRFSDMPEAQWARDAIEYVTGKGLFEGVGEGKFEPGMQMTRAMFVTVLSRFGTKIGSKWNVPCETPAQFGDIPAGQWYSEPVAWAGGTGLVKGIGENEFGPQISITREQIAVMMVNFAKLCGAELPVTAQAAEFTDAADISDWAADAVRIAQQAGLIYGREQGEFGPRQTASRVEVAAILQRFAENVK